MSDKRDSPVFMLVLWMISFLRRGILAMTSAPLPDLDTRNIEALKALLIAKHSQLQERNTQLISRVQEIKHLKLVIEKYRRMIFGGKREKLTGQLEQLEFTLEELETAQATQDATEAGQPSSTGTDSKRRCRPARKPLVEDLRRWMKRTLASLSTKSETAGAIRYALVHWNALTRYLDDGLLEIDNNAGERALRTVAICLFLRFLAQQLHASHDFPPARLSG